METEMVEIIKMLKDAAPYVWEAARHQVLVAGYTNLVVAVISTIIVLIASGRFYKLMVLDGIEDEKDFLIGMLAGVTTILFSIIAMLTWNDAVFYLFSSNWATIELILKTVSGG